MSENTVAYCFHPSPLGRLLLAGTSKALQLISFPEGSRAREPDVTWMQSDAPFVTVRRQLDEYFAGQRMRFELTLEPRATAFQASVYAALQQIPYGETRAYGAIAAAIGRPRAVRAVGAANGSNPLPIVVPCHRVLGRDGSLTGFGGGLEAKRYLLALEKDQTGLFAQR